MTNEGSAAMWTAADSTEVVPAPVDPVLGAVLRNWFALPRSWSCLDARRSGVWVVVMPTPNIWCADHAAEVFKNEDRCCYCGDEVNRWRSYELVAELGGVSFIGRAHPVHIEKAQQS